ncbi:MAG: glycosyl transferase family protein [Sphingomonadaceae bacterium]|nr:glycosyl transferase family protein [Sphingomonadaceae bacterium]
MTGSAGEIGWALEAVLLAERELLLFAGFWIAVGLIDELAIDLSWLWLKLTGRARTRTLPAGYGDAPLAGPLAVFIPAYAESAVIGVTIRHLLKTWQQDALRLYVGCYRNDPATLAAAVAAAAGDPRLRVVLVDAAGPTTKADCLNRLYAALQADEGRGARRFRGVILHDAEDMVHPAALQAIDAALGAVDFVQLPVRPVCVSGNTWIAGHYADEFTESHAKTMVVRNALGLALPAAGVGCGLSRGALDRLVALQAEHGQAGPFSPEALTEDYEIGLILSNGGRGSAFLRLRAADGSLVATASCFPSTLAAAVRQKTRWIHGIAFQGWDRLGWSARPLECWMALRDRRGPLTALVLAAAYALLAIDAVLVLGQLGALVPSVPLTETHRLLLALGLIGLAWRALFKVLFVGQEYGWTEGLRAVLRIPVANVIAIMAGRRALLGYIRSLGGQPVGWDKTEHFAHPAAAGLHEVAA